MVRPLHLLRRGVAMMSFVKGWPLEFAIVPRATCLTLWWVWWVSGVWGTTWVGTFVPDWCGGGVGARECPSRSDCSSRSNNLLFYSFSWAISSACCCRSSSCLHRSSSWRNWFVTPFWSNSCIWVWRVWSIIICSSVVLSLLVLFIAETIFACWNPYVWEKRLPGPTVGANCTCVDVRARVILIHLDTQLLSC